MSKKTNTKSGQGTPTIEGIADLEARKAALKEQVKAEKAAAKLAEWEQRTKERNPAFMVGSTRKATEADEAILGHVHGQVCEIKCQHEGCSTVRVINKQDAFQVRFCQEHKKTAGRARAKARRQAKHAAARTPEVIRAEIAELEAQLQAKQAAG